MFKPQDYYQQAGPIRTIMLLNGPTWWEGVTPMKDRYERHRQAWTQAEIQKLHMLVAKGMSLKAIAKSLTRSEESTKSRAKQDKLKIQKKR
nr:hypothetical protein [Algimonas ampicilliniresistens]